MSLRIILAGVPDRENLVFEIWDDDSQVAEVSFENDETALEIYPKPGGGPWILDFADFRAKIQEIVDRSS